MKFFKAHSLGNDFILIQTENSLEDISKKFILKINNRFTGIGADQVLVVDKNKNVKIWTEDGCTLTLCGNGLRCLGKLLGQNNTFKTESGLVYTSVLEDGNVSLQISKNIPIKKMEDHYLVDVGNLHKIYLVEDNSQIDVVSYVNDDYIVSFLSFINGIWKIRTMENHTTKETLACGSAALASAYALYYLGYKDLVLNYKHGSISHVIDSEKILQVGPAEIVAEIIFVEQFINSDFINNGE